MTSYTNIILKGLNNCDKKLANHPHLRANL